MARMYSSVLPEPVTPCKQHRRAILALRHQTLDRLPGVILVGGQGGDDGGRLAVYPLTGHGKLPGG